MCDADLTSVEYGGADGTEATLLGKGENFLRWRFMNDALSQVTRQDLGICSSWNVSFHQYPFRILFFLFFNKGDHEHGYFYKY